MAITCWDVVYLLQVVGVCLSVALIYLLGGTLSGRGAIQSRLLMLGRYSLLAYIAQIVVLQLLLVVLRDVNAAGPRWLMSLVAAVVLTQASVEIVEMSRLRWRSCDQLYRFIFA
jgi:peptidoglycan/LPS O-acetylase OafA/YrhL